jgi:alkyldihydroxyacetonephosphate synthase
MRVSDEAETALGLARPDNPGRSSGTGGCLAIVGFEGSAQDVARRRAVAEPALTDVGATPMPEAGREWVRGRYRGPYLRDSLLDSGALVETLETVAFWSSLSALYAAVGDALRRSLTELGTPPVILCHVSHVYPAGASLYFTVACAQLEDPIAQWLAAKSAASEAILATGGSITHHHGIGVDHRQWYEREVGSLSVAMLRAAKRTVDPAGVLNPGVLIAPDLNRHAASTG